jgi:hypothetical protein
MAVMTRRIDLMPKTHNHGPATYADAQGNACGPQEYRGNDNVPPHLHRTYVDGVLQPNPAREAALKAAEDEAAAVNALAAEALELRHAESADA